MVLDHLAKPSGVDLVKDKCIEKSIKLCGCKQRRTLERPKDLSTNGLERFQVNDENKTQLIKYLFDQWKKSPSCKQIHGRVICFAKSEQCYHLTSTDTWPVAARSVIALATSHEKADARIVISCINICETALNTIYVYLISCLIR